MTSVWRQTIVAACIGAVMAAVPLNAGESTRVKDLTTLIGVRPTPLIGYGLVVGLNKTGDRRQTLFSTQSVANMLRRFGVVVPADQMRIENVAAVMVTSEIPPFVRSGGRVDVVVSSIGDARSLQGGHSSQRLCVAPMAPSMPSRRALCRSVDSAPAARETRCR